MYKDNRQLRIEDFVFPYGKLDSENDWVRLAVLVPWNVAEEQYAAQFVNNGHPAHPARMALGALLIQRRLKCSDQWLVKHIGENPYLQYFIGMKEYGRCPFGASTLVAFRKRFSEKDLAAILEASVPKAEKKDDCVRARNLTSCRNGLDFSKKEGRVAIMCRVMEDMRNQTLREGMIEVAKKLLTDGSILRVNVPFFLLGLLTNCFILSALYAYSGSLWICVMTHALINALSQIDIDDSGVAGILLKIVCMIIAVSLYRKKYTAFSL